ncbi:response regulator [Cyanobacteria bacterium FACHB-63]|nr:response regulator [Cyanobacteria bacterium FACHB-63]
MQKSQTRMPTAGKVRLRLVLVAPFVLQTFVTVGLVGYLSFKNGQKAVNELADQLIDKTNQLVAQRLDSYLATPWQINQLNLDAIERGQLDTNNLESAGRHFWKQAQLYPTVSYISFTLSNKNGAGAGRWLKDHGLLITENSAQTQRHDVSYATNAQGDRLGVVERASYDGTIDTWYVDAVKAGKPTWTRIYAAEGYDSYVVASASVPFYRKDRQLAGVLGVDLMLTGISDFLRQLKVSSAGKVFIIERNGLLVAQSTEEPTFRVGKGEPERIAAIASQNPLIQATAKQLQQQFGDLRSLSQTQQLEFDLGSERKFVRVSPWRDQYGLDWLVVVVVPEKDFMEQINANAQTTFWLCLGALGVTILFGLYTSRWITQPFHRLSQASEEIASGQWEQSIVPSRVIEVNALGDSFNRMAKQLRESFNVLEHRVEERTAALQAAKEEAEASKLKADIANQAKSEFLANMSHELRTPLNGILGYAQILQRSYSLTAKDQKGIEIIHQCGSHLLTLINDVLDLSKIEARKLALHPTEFYFPAFLQSVVEMCRIKAEQKNITFQYTAKDLVTAISADEKRLRQVLINLLGNAIKFTDRNGKVTFEVRTQKLEGGNYRIRFQVSDTGVGMTPEQIEKIFLPFEQVGDTKRQAEGTGLGLSISQSIVALMSSELNVESQPGIGSTFWFEIDVPEAIDWSATSRTAPQGTIIGYEGQRRKILVVDDRWENRAILAGLLEAIGFELIEAIDGREGLNAAKCSRPDLIITDLLMPVMDGFELLKQLRQTETVERIPVIVSSASVFELDQHKSIEAGADAFLAKPVPAGVLLELLQRFLQLQWIYGTLETAEPLSDVNSTNEMIAPSKDNLALLYDLTMQGLVNELIKQCDQLDTDPALIPFTQTIRRSAEQFQLDAIQTFIEQFL